MGLLAVGEASFGADGISLGLASGSLEAAYLGETIPWSAVRDVDLAAAPPEVRTVDGRTVFVDARLRDELADGVRAAGVPVAERPDVWDRLMQPFLDTHMPDSVAQADAQLVGWGFTLSEISEIRDGVSAYVAPYALLMLEWVHLGACDLIEARLQFDAAFEPTPGAYVSWRRWIDAIADRSRG